MDVPLYAIALVVFAVLYLAIGVFLAYVLLITLLVMFAYLVIRYPHLPDEYPYGSRDTSITVIFIGITWGIFTFLGPKTPIPFVGAGLTYTPAGAVPIVDVLILAFGVAVIMLAIFSFWASRDDRRSSGGLGSEEKPKQGVGAG
jgi:hypothetical protein